MITPFPGASRGAQECLLAVLVWEIMIAQKQGNTKLRPSVSTQPRGATPSVSKASEFGGPTVREFGTV